MHYAIVLYRFSALNPVGDDTSPVVFFAILHGCENLEQEYLSLHSATSFI